MAELKTKATTQDPKDFLNKIEPEQKKADGLVLLEMFQKVTGEKAVMWGDSIVGFAGITTGQKEVPKKGTGLWLDSLRGSKI